MDAAVVAEAVELEEESIDRTDTKDTEEEAQGVATLPGVSDGGVAELARVTFKREEKML